MCLDTPSRFSQGSQVSIEFGLWIECIKLLSPSKGKGRGCAWAKSYYVLHFSHFCEIIKRVKNWMNAASSAIFALFWLNWPTYVLTGQVQEPQPKSLISVLTIFFFFLKAFWVNIVKTTNRGNNGKRLCERPTGQNHMLSLMFHPFSLKLPYLYSSPDRVHLVRRGFFLKLATAEARLYTPNSTPSPHTQTHASWVFIHQRSPCCGYPSSSDAKERKIITPHSRWIWVCAKTPLLQVNHEISKEPGYNQSNPIWFE